MPAIPFIRKRVKGNENHLSSYNATTAHNTAQSSQLAERTAQVRLEILPILQTDTNAQQTAIDRLIRHSAPLNQGFHATERGSMLEEMQFTRQMTRGSLFFHLDGEDGTEAIGHLLLEPVALDLLQTCVEDFAQHGLHGGFLAAWCRVGSSQGGVKPGDDTGCVVALTLDADFEGAETTDAEPAFHVAHHAADEESVLVKLFGPVVALGDKHAAQDVAVPPEVFRSGVHDQIGTMLERILEARRRKGAVDDQVGTARMCLLCVRGDVEGDAFGVDRCLKENDVAGFQLFRRTVQIELLQSGHTSEQADHTVAAVVAITHGNAAWVEQSQGGVQSRETGRVAEGFAFAEGGEDSFKASEIGCGEPGVNVRGGVGVFELYLFSPLERRAREQDRASFHTLEASAAGIRSSGLSEYRKVVDRCNGGATSVTTLSTSSAWSERVAAPMASLECDMVEKWICYVGRGSLYAQGKSRSRS